eukprot:scaffold1697_cov120-Cylindrotheca_fusiformis.AAC.36
MDTIIRLLLSSFCFFGSLVIHARSEQLHRVFPAAQVEVYNRENDGTLGIVKPSQLSIQSKAPSSTSSIVDAAIDRFRKTLLMLPDFAEDYEENPEHRQLQEMTKILIQVASSDVQLREGVDESYTLCIEANSSGVELKSKTAFGVVRGLETLGQLMDFGWVDGAGDPVLIIDHLPLSVKDFPAFGFRGLLIDTSRHYLPLELILSNLDAMAMNKLNLLHWHLTDSQSFPFEAESMPELASKGAYHPKMVYTTKDIQTVVKEAYLRGIRVVPEVDLPGHSQSIVSSHPELMSSCPSPSEPIDPTNPSVYDFVRTVYSDLSKVFPDDFVHVGGDEVDFSCWQNSSRISNWMKTHNMTKSVELYEYFETRLLNIVKNQSKTPIVWQEVFNLNLTVTKDTIIDIWKGFDRKTMKEATERGFRIVLSGCWYLDYLNCDWDTFYDCNATNFTGAVDLLVGGHASMWGEHVDTSNFMSRVWPRASAVAERLWTGNVDWARQNARARIHKFRCKMVQKGFAAEPIGPGFCPHEVPFSHSDHSNVVFEEATAIREDLF